MWNLLDRFGRPSLSRHVQLEALELNQRALRLLSPDAGPICGPEWAGELVAATIAGDACWRALRGTLGDVPDGPRWPTVKACLQAQAWLLRTLEPLTDGLPADQVRPLSAEHRHQLQGTLLDQSRWLGVLVQRPAPPQRLLEAQVVRVYRKARRDLRKQPDRRRARRRLRRLLALVELTGAGSGPIEHGRLAALARACRRLYPMVVEHGRLTERIASARSRRRARTLKRRQRQLARAINREVVRHFSQRPKQFADRLPWEIFCTLSEQPQPRSGTAMATVRPRSHG